MDDTLWVAMNGAKQALDMQTMYASNLANSKTTGFQADLHQAQSVGLSGAVSTQVYSVPDAFIPDMTPGNIITTGKELDVAVDAQGFLTVQSPDGSEAYTRSGELQIDANGILTNAHGYPVLGNGGPIAIPPAAKIEIAKDGTISIRPLGKGSKAMVTLDRLKLVKPDPQDLMKTTNGLIKTKSGKVAEADASISVIPGALNSSNVNIVGTMVDMISAARQFEMQMRIMQEVKSQSESAARLLQIS